MNPPIDMPVRLRPGQEPLFKAGASGVLWCVLEGTVRLDRESGPSRLPVQIALPGDLVGIESLCEQSYQFTARAFTECRLEPVRVDSEAQRQALLSQALFQQQLRSHDMAMLRTGSVVSRVASLLRLLGLPWQGAHRVDGTEADALRSALPALRELAHMVDAKAETVCRALAQLLPPRSRKSGPARQLPVQSVSLAGFAHWVSQPLPSGAAA
jgi:Cyclic nucleotide-binding domain